jgi:hypothetical protein
MSKPRMLVNAASGRSRGTILSALTDSLQTDAGQGIFSTTCSPENGNRLIALADKQEVIHTFHIHSQRKRTKKKDTTTKMPSYSIQCGRIIQAGCREEFLPFTTG